jgi:hypothetical protein
MKIDHELILSEHDHQENNNNEVDNSGLDKLIKDVYDSTNKTDAPANSSVKFDSALPAINKATRQSRTSLNKESASMELSLELSDRSGLPQEDGDDSEGEVGVSSDEDADIMTPAS